MQKITPFLWFNDNAEEAVNFYTSVFNDSSIGVMNRYTDAGPGPAGSVMVATFTIQGQSFTALNGGPHFKFTEAVSFVINCETQQEVDEYWEALSAGGEKSRCGWLKDKFGLSWQVVPIILQELLSDPDPKKVQPVMEAMMKMDKLDIAALQSAVDGTSK